jgi:hypothetical protein
LLQIDLQSLIQDLVEVGVAGSVFQVREHQIDVFGGGRMKPAPEQKRACGQQQDGCYGSRPQPALAADAGRRQGCGDGDFIVGFFLDHHAGYRTDGVHEECAGGRGCGN